MATTGETKAKWTVDHDDGERPGGNLQALRKAAAAAEARYDHETAVAHYSAALDLPDLTPQEQFEIRHARAEVYWRWGQRLQCFADWEQLIPAARAARDPALLAEILALFSYRRGYMGRYYAVQEALAREAVALAQEIVDERLLSFALMGLAFTLSPKDAGAVRLCKEQALDAARRSGASDALVSALRSMSDVYVDENKRERAQELMAEARAVAAQSGDLTERTYALFDSGFVQTDLALGRNFYDQALVQNRVLNDQMLSGVIANNLALIMWSLGLYARALSLAIHATGVYRSRHGSPTSIANGLDGVGRAYLGKGLLDEAEASFREGLVTLDHASDALEGYLFLGLAQVALAQGQAQTAIEHLQIILNKDEFFLANAEAALGDAHLALGNLPAALQHTGEAVAALEAGYFVPDYPVPLIWLSRYQALSMKDNEQAFDALDRARKAMFEALENVSDEGLRRNYLNKVSVNRQIVLTWTEEAARRGIPLDPFTAHVPLAGNYRDQMRRLADIGSRLAAEHDPENLTAFIIEEFVEMSGVERALLLLLDEQHDLRVAAAHNPEDAFSQARSLLDTVRRSHWPTLRENIGAVPDGKVPELHRRSLIALPLVAQDRLLGMLYGDMRQIFGRFNDDDLNLLDMLAHHAAAALANADLVSTLEDRVKERTAELQTANEALAEAKAEAERANKAKSTFLSNMSHELRTPLNAIIGFTRIVQRKTKDMLPQKQLDNLGKVLSSSEHLLGLINTILDIAKIESGRMDVINSRFQVGPLIENLAMTAQPLLRRDVVLQTDVAPDLPALVSDQDKVKQILLNLLSNAAKFTHEGTITIRAYPAGEIVAIDVIDTGIGISAEALGRIFEEFQQANELTQRHYGGTGLGLSISRQLARLLGGDLTAASVEGAGSTFTLVLPWEA